MPLRTCKWNGLGQGAEEYGYSDARSFLRVLQRGKVLGAIKSGNCWRSHPEGIAGSIGPKRANYILPMGTITGICLSQRGTVVIDSHLGPKRNSLDVWSAIGSAWVGIKFTKI